MARSRYSLQGGTQPCKSNPYQQRQHSLDNYREPEDTNTHAVDNSTDSKR